MRLRSFAFFAFLGLCSSVAACDFLLEEEKDDEETPTPTNTNTPTPEPSVAPTPVTTVDGDITTIDWGTIALDPGLSPHFDFTAPAGTISIDFMAIGGAADQAKIFGFFSLVGPGNRTVIDNSSAGPARQAFAEAAMSFSVPSDDTATTAAAAGFWRFHVLAADENDFLASAPQVLVKVRTAPAGVPTGEIDVNVIIVEGVNANMTAAQACTPGNAVYDGIAAASVLFEAALNLTITPITGAECYDLTGSSAFTVIDGQDQLGDLFETSGLVADQRLTLFIVDSFAGDLNSAAGVAGSVPIPMQMNGTRRSGVAIEYNSNSTFMAETIAHEMGHSLGLYHTSEFNAATNGFDPITDTLTCPNLGLSDPGNCPDDTNVMFPQLTGGFSGFTAGQGTVIAPAVHVRRQGQPAFAPGATWVKPAFRPAWEGPPLRCVNGVVSRS